MNPSFTAIPGLFHLKHGILMHNSNISHKQPTKFSGLPRMTEKSQKKILTIWSQVLEPIIRPLTASFYSNIRKVLKMGIKLKWGETPTSRSLRKLPKFGTHAKPSPRRATFLLAPKTADGRIARISREKCSLSLNFFQNGTHCNSLSIPPQIHVLLLI